MEVLALAVLVAGLYVVAYLTYGRWLGRRVFRVCASRVCPSVELEDGRDFVPSHRLVVFGHHFTSIAGTGPIVGPAIGVIWGWLPALLWVVLGSIFAGAVHDFGALVVSLRHKGKSVGELAGLLVGPRARWLFLGILVLALTVVLAVFGLVIASVLRQFPSAIFPCLAQVPLAVGIGLWLRKRGTGLVPLSLGALAVMMVTVVWGDAGWLHGLNEWLAGQPVWVWTGGLLVYCYVASVLPVWVLLQPRDFINALQLVFMLGLLAAGVVGAGVFGGPVREGHGGGQVLELVAPVVQWAPEGAPPIFPFLFITIACGAISGFHCLVSSGTSSKQLRSEGDAQFVGFGAMLLEGGLAVLVILACAAGVGLGIKTPEGWLAGREAWQHLYANWGQAGSLAATVGAFVQGAGNFLGVLGVPERVASAMMGVFVASFAATTMDSACRLQRYVLQELIGGILGTAGGAQRSGDGAAGEGMSGVVVRGRRRGVLEVLAGPHGATLVAVVAAGLIAAVPPPGKPWGLENAGMGGMLLWPLFGATNQLLGGLALVVVAFYLKRSGQPLWFLAGPLVLMLVMPFWALAQQIFAGSGGAESWLAAGKWPLVFVGTACLGLEVWLVVEAFVQWGRVGNAGISAGGDSTKSECGV